MADDMFVVGYGGWAILHFEAENSNYYDGPKEKAKSNYKDSYLSGTLVQVSGASISETLNIPSANSYYLPFDGTGEAKSPMRVAYGTLAYNGDISFDLTEGTASSIFTDSFYKRNALFSLQFFDGQNTCTVRNCVWSSVNLSCSPGGIVKVSISFQSNNGYLSGLQISDSDLNSSIEYSDSSLLIPYWQCGKEHFLEFTLGFSRNLSPVYLNNDLLVPSYIRPGMIDVSVSTTTLEYVESWGNEFKIQVGKSHAVKLNGAVLKNTQYQMSSMSDTGSKTYEWTSIVDTVTNPVFSFEN